MPCVLCEAAPHPPCEAWAQVHVAGGGHDEGTTIDVCMQHHRVIEAAIREDAGTGERQHSETDSQAVPESDGDE
jgi:hypothetical protein